MMTAADIRATTFMETLQQTIPLLKRFVRLLKKERQALNALEAETIMACAEEKEALLSQLEPLVQRLQATVPAEGSLRQLLRDYLTRTPDMASEEAAFIHRFLDLSAEAERLNRHNGILIRQLLQHNTRLLAILRGQPVDTAYAPPARSKQPRVASATAALIARA